MHLCADGYHMDTQRVRKAHTNLDGLELNQSKTKRVLCPSEPVKLSQCR